MQQPITAPSLSPLQLALKRVDRMNALFELGTAMNAARTRDTLIPLILREGARCVAAERCVLYLLDRESGTFRTGPALGAPADLRAAPGQGLVGAAAQSGQVLRVPSAPQDPRFDPAVDGVGESVAALLVPLLDPRGAAVGVLAAYAPEAQFDEGDADLLHALGGLASCAL